ncbi:MAG: DUF58 domain-containing protein [Candidatus Helarchaeota archaeon]
MITQRARYFILGGILFLFIGFWNFPGNYFLILLGVIFILASVISIPFFEASVDVSKDLILERTYDKDKVFVNEFIHITIKIKNVGTRDYDYIEVYDIYPPQAFTLVLGENWMGTRIDAGGEITFSYILQARLRGVYNLGPAKLIVRDRLGFHVEDTGIDVITETLVYPDFQDIRRMQAFAGKRRQGIIYGIHSHKQKGLGAEFYGIRQYTSGDEFRRIDWKATAKTRKLMTREFESEKNIRVLILLDVSNTMTRGKFEEDKLEYSIRATILLANLALERRDQVGLLLFSNKTHYFVEPSAGNRQVYTIMENLSRVQAKGKKVLMEAIDYAVKRIPKASFFFIITDCENVKDEFVEALKIARSYKHQCIIISPFGPWFEGRPEELSNIDMALTTAVSEELWEKRLELKKKAGQFGVDIIDVGPADFFPIVITEYQKAKKKGTGLV